MKLLALDVGINTGWAATEWVPRNRHEMKLEGCGTEKFIGSQSEISGQAQEWVSHLLEEQKPQTIVVEWPLTSYASKYQSSLINLSLGLRKGLDLALFPIIYTVTPSQWKIFPILNSHPFTLQKGWENYTPTQHEEDALSILYWWIRFGPGSRQG